MSIDEPALRRILASELTESLLRVCLILFLVFLCARIFAPFASLFAWGLIIAVALQPLHHRLASRMGNRQGLAATVLVCATFLLLGVPTAILADSFAGYLRELHASVEAGTVAIRPPAASVAEWPVIGGKLYAAWNTAATNLPAFVIEHQETLKAFSLRALSAAASTAGGILLFLASMIVAAIMLAYTESGSRAIGRVFNRMFDSPRGLRLQQLATATIRSVAAGVIGVAFIQAILLGLGFLMAGIPAAGVLALVVMLLGILQLPALLISLPAVAYLWWLGDGSTTSNVLFTIYLLVAGMADNVLKPLLLGRGVDAPMVVILIGALGGMVAGGIIGLFVGGVLLAVAYTLFMEWVAAPQDGRAS